MNNVIKQSKNFLSYFLVAVMVYVIFGATGSLDDVQSVVRFLQRYSPESWSYLFEYILKQQNLVAKLDQSNFYSVMKTLLSISWIISFVVGFMFILVFGSFLIAITVLFRLPIIPIP